MKKIATIILMFGALSLTTSCKKKWTCKCTTTYNGITTTSQGTDTEKRTRKDAKALCEANNATTTIGGFSSTLECHLD